MSTPEPQRGLFDLDPPPTATSRPSAEEKAAWDNAYYNSDTPLISDAEYDALAAADTIGAAPPAGSQTAPLTVPMLSLDKSLSPEMTAAFLKTISTAIPGARLILEPKIDGLSCQLTYIEGRLERATTRGDGLTGEVITAAVSLLPGVPDRIDTDAAVVVINGEIAMPKAALDDLNRTIEQAGGKPYANTRNTAAGSIRHSDPTTARDRGVVFLAYDIPNAYIPKADITSQQDVLSWLRDNGFTTFSQPNTVLTGPANPNCLTDVEALCDTMFRFRDNYIHDIDGIVIKLDDLGSRSLLGETGHHPKWAIARKPKAATAITRILSITIQVGSTGTLTPVAELAPTPIGGVTVTRATLHNEDFIKSLDLRPHDKIVLSRAGDVIPQIIGRVESDTPREPPWTFPPHCPACGQPALRDETREAARYCSAPMTCAGTRTAHMVRIVGRDIFDIGGLGPESIRGFIRLGLLTEPADLFLLPARINGRRGDLPEGWGPTKTANLAASIELARRPSLDRFMMSLGIRHLGHQASRTLSRELRTVDCFIDTASALAAGDADAGKRLLALPDIGPILINNIANWFKAGHNVDAMLRLKEALEIAETTVTAPPAGPLQGHLVVFTGTFARGSRDEMRARAESLGAQTSDSISAKTTMLVYGDKAGSKIDKANKLVASGKASMQLLDQRAWDDLCATGSET